MTQLERDIDRRINERLVLWCHDTVQLAQMAGLPTHIGVTMMAKALLCALGTVLECNDFSAEEAAEAMRIMMQQRGEHIARRKALEGK